MSIMNQSLSNWDENLFNLTMGGNLSNNFDMAPGIFYTVDVSYTQRAISNRKP